MKTEDLPIAWISMVAIIALIITVLVMSAGSRRRDMEKVAIERGKRGSDAAHFMEFEEQLVSCKPEIKKIIEEKGLLTKAKQTLERAEMLAEGEQKNDEMKTFQHALTDLGLAMSHCKDASAPAP